MLIQIWEIFFLISFFLITLPIYTALHGPITKLLQGVHDTGQSYEYTHIFPRGASFMLRFSYLSHKFPLFPHHSNSCHHQPRWTPQSTIFPTKQSLFKHCSRRPLFHSSILFHFSSTNTQTAQNRVTK